MLKKPDTKDHSYDSASGTGAPGVVTFTETGGSEATRGRRRGAGSITVQRGGGGGWFCWAQRHVSEIKSGGGSMTFMNVTHATEQ